MKSLSLENAIAIKYLHKIQDSLPELNIQFHENYLKDKKIHKTSQEKEYMKQAIAIIDRVFLYVKERALEGELY